MWRYFDDFKYSGGFVNLFLIHFSVTVHFKAGFTLYECTRTICTRKAI